MASGIAYGNFSVAIGGGCTTTGATCSMAIAGGATYGCNSVAMAGGITCGTCSVAMLGGVTNKDSSIAIGALICGDITGNTLCINGRTFIDNLSAVTNTNVIYYDTNTKELTYGATPLTGLTGALQTANNGLSYVDDNVTLGGVLTGNTIFDDNGS